MFERMIRRCGACGQDNRVPARHLSHTGRCGACRAPLEPLSEPLEVDEKTFDEIVSQAPVPVLVDFWAPWCGPCRMVAPEVKKAAVRLKGGAIVLKVNTDQNPALSARYSVQSIPNFSVFSGGRRVAERSGAMGHEQLVALAGGLRTDRSAAR
jgi:thioredoxin 2